MSSKIWLVFLCFKAHRFSSDLSLAWLLQSDAKHQKNSRFFRSLRSGRANLLPLLAAVFTTESVNAGFSLRFARLELGSFSCVAATPKFLEACRFLTHHMGPVIKSIGCSTVITTSHPLLATVCFWIIIGLCTTTYHPPPPFRPTH